MGVCYFFAFIVLIIALVADWMLFKKLGFKGWYSLIPGFNGFLLCKRLYGDGWFVFFALIPGFNIVALILLINRLSYKFGKNFGFTVGLILLEPIFAGYLAFSQLQTLDVAQNPVNKDVELVSCVVGDIQKYVERHKTEA